MSWSIVTESPEATERIGAALAEALPKGSVVALFGDLATGKTCLVRGMAKRLGAMEGVHSPTFTLVNRYGERMPLLHLDLYRLESPEQVAELGYEELFDPDGICVVEWAERAAGLLPEERVEIHLEHAGGDKRMLEISGTGSELLEALMNKFAAAGLSNS